MAKTRAKEKTNTEGVEKLPHEDNPNPNVFAFGLGPEGKRCHDCRYLKTGKVCRGFNGKDIPGNKMIPAKSMKLVTQTHCELAEGTKREGRWFGVWDACAYFREREESGG